jgi:hypothetical protein
LKETDMTRSMNSIKCEFVFFMAQHDCFQCAEII